MGYKNFENSFLNVNFIQKVLILYVKHFLHIKKQISL